MKKNYKLLFAALLMFGILRFLPLFCSKEKKEESNEESVALKVPSISLLVANEILENDTLSLLNHPWIQSQKMQKILPEMKRDMLDLQEYICHVSKQALEKGKAPPKEEVVMKTLMTAIKTTQANLPFDYPVSYYNVMMIPQTAVEDVKAPFPFQVHKRLYLGDTEIGKPFYLDVRVFDLKNDKMSLEDAAEEVVQWHLAGVKEVRRKGNIFLGCGCPSKTRHPDAGSIEGERGVYLHYIRRGEKLFVAYAEAPLTAFEKHMSLFGF